METIVIDWMQTNLKNLTNNEDTYFYAFTRARSLIYIGITKKTSAQSITDEVLNSINRLGIANQGLSVWLGYVNTTTNHSGLRKRINDSTILDTESLLILGNQPSANEKCKQSYSGRLNFRVISRGCDLIIPTICVDSNGKLV